MFGKSALPLFHLESGYTNVNHGSYGSCPKVVTQALHNYSQQLERNPDRFFRYEMESIYKNTLKSLAKYISCEASDIVLVENVSEATNSIFRSFSLHDQVKRMYGESSNFTPTILYFNFAYGMVKYTLQYVAKEFHYNLFELNYTIDDLSKGDAHLIQKMRQQIDQFHTENPNSKIVIASLDHISSVPHFIFPIQQLCTLCKELNILSYVDGAHAIGQINVNITQMNPDFYTSNCHKWLLSARGSGFLYVKKEFQVNIHPTIISWGYNKNFLQEFLWVGTKDYSALFTIKDAIEYREKTWGEDKLMNYNHNLATQVGETVATIFGTKVMISDTTKIGSLVNVELPCHNSVINQQVVDELMKTYNTFLVVFELEGKCWTRLSCQAFNTAISIEAKVNSMFQIHKNFTFESPTSEHPFPDMHGFIPKLASLELNGLPSLFSTDLSNFEGMMLSDNESVVDSTMHEVEIPFSDKVYPHQVLHSKHIQQSSFGQVENIRSHPLFNIFELYFLELSYNAKMKIISRAIMNRLIPFYSHFCYRLSLPSLSQEEFNLFCVKNCLNGTCGRAIALRSCFEEQEVVKRCWQKVICGSLLNHSNWVDLNDDNFGSWEGVYPKGAQSTYKCEIDKLDFFYDPTTMAFECSFTYVVAVFQVDNKSWASSW